MNDDDVVSWRKFAQSHGILSELNNVDAGKNVKTIKNLFMVNSRR
jgi:hypothetical protein